MKWLLIVLTIAEALAFPSICRCLINGDQKGTVPFFVDTKIGTVPDQTADDLVLWYRQPAKQWVEALPVGNGRLGCMVFGGIKEERLQLNEDSLWSGSPQDSDNPEALAALAEIRRLLFAEKYAEANSLTNRKMICKGPGSDAALTARTKRWAI